MTDAERMELDTLREEKRSTQKWNYFIGGFVVSALLCSGAWVAYTALVQMPNSQLKIDDSTEKVAAAQVDLGKCQLQIGRIIASQKVTQSPIPKTENRFTLLYDSSGLVTPTNSPMEILNLVRPGLGTMIGKLSPTTQPTGDMRPAWFIPANVNPVFYGDVNTAVVLRIQDNQIIARETPLTPQQVQTNPALLVVAQ